MNFDVQVIPHAEQRYDTVGDWYMDEMDTDEPIMHIRVSNTANWRYHLCLIVHEMVEATMCVAEEITSEQVDAFDKKFMADGRPGEPGDDELAPYYHQHQEATHIERELANVLDVRWSEYEKAIASLGQ
jgi:hypothetical protein